MGTAKAVVFILTIKAALVGGLTVPGETPVVYGYYDGPGPVVRLQQPVGLIGESLTYSSNILLTTLYEPSPQTIAALFRPGQYREGQMELQSGSASDVTLSFPGPAGATVRRAYLEAAGPGLYRRKGLATVPGRTVTVRRIMFEPLGDATSREFEIRLSHEQLTPEGLDPALGAYIGRPSVRSKEVRLVRNLGDGRPVLFYWEGPASAEPGYGASSEAPAPLAGAPANQPGGPHTPTVLAPADSPPPSPPVVVLPGATALPGPAASPNPKLRQSQALAVLLEIKRVDGEAPPAAEQQPNAPAAAALSVDRELIEAKIRELNARSDEAQARLETAKAKETVAEGRFNAGLAPPEEMIEARGAIAQAKAELARLKAEIDTQRILLRRAGGPMPASVAVSGAVTKPGVYALAPNETVASLLARAGCPSGTPTADIVVIRRNANRVQLLRPSTAADGQLNLQLLDGDTVYVPGRAAAAGLPDVGLPVVGQPVVGQPLEPAPPVPVAPPAPAAPLPDVK